MSTNGSCIMVVGIVVGSTLLSKHIICWNWFHSFKAYFSMNNQIIGELYLDCGFRGIRVVTVNFWFVTYGYTLDKVGRIMKRNEGISRIMDLLLRL